MGKGSKRRPTDEAAYAEGWERIFGLQDVHGHKAQAGREAGPGEVQPPVPDVATEARG